MTPPTPSGLWDHRHSWTHDRTRCSICGLTRGRYMRALNDRRVGREAVEAYRLAIRSRIEAATGYITVEGGINVNLRLLHPTLLRLIEGEKPAAYLREDASPRPGESPSTDPEKG